MQAWSESSDRKPTLSGPAVPTRCLWAGGSSEAGQEMGNTEGWEGVGRPAQSKNEVNTMRRKYPVSEKLTTTDPPTQATQSVIPMWWHHRPLLEMQIFNIRKVIMLYTLNLHSTHIKDIAVRPKGKKKYRCSGPTPERLRQSVC